MIQKRYDLWEDGEYNYPLSFGFVPNLMSYLHEDTTPRPCIVVVPGGGYRIVSPTEGEIVAKKFYAMGYQTFVCTYTVNMTGGAPLGDQPSKDLARAVRYIRKHADRFHVIPDQIVVCGFSAGAHLCGCLCVHHEELRDDHAGFTDISARPDAAILSYPVITAGKYAHRDSFQALLGKDPGSAALRYMSLETQVTENTSPCFLWQTAADELVPVENSLLMAQALKDKGVPFACHIFSQGPHALSAADQDWADGKYGDPYTLEQIFDMVKLLKSGGIPCPEKEKKQLLDSFDYSNPNRQASRPRLEPNKEVQIWPDLADQWLKLVFENKQPGR